MYSLWFLWLPILTASVPAVLITLWWVYHDSELSTGDATCTLITVNIDVCVCSKCVDICLFLCRWSSWWHKALTISPSLPGIVWRWQGSTDGDVQGGYNLWMTWCHCYLWSSWWHKALTISALMETCGAGWIQHTYDMMSLLPGSPRVCTILTNFFICYI